MNYIFQIVVYAVILYGAVRYLLKEFTDIYDYGSKSDTLHIAISMLIMLFVFLFAYFVTNKTVAISLELGIFVTIVIGICKELYDKFYKHTYFSLGDINKDILGGFYMLIIIVMVYLFNVMVLAK